MTLLIDLVDQARDLAGAGAPEFHRFRAGGAGARLRDAVWALYMAAKTSAETGSFMVDNDGRYARYAAFLADKG